MAQLVVRDIEDAVKARLKRRAEMRGHSMEEEIRQILRNAANEPLRPCTGLGTTISQRFASHGLDRDIPELRGTPARPADLRR
jgi:antitoxin FitA